MIVLYIVFPCFVLVFIVCQYVQSCLSACNLSLIQYRLIEVSNAIEGEEIIRFSSILHTTHDRLSVGLLSAYTSRTEDDMINNY